MFKAIFDVIVELHGRILITSLCCAYWQKAMLQQARHQRVKNTRGQTDKKSKTTGLQVIRMSL
jgi:hypothetical protein